MGTIVNKTTLQHFGEKFLENLDGRFVAQETGKGLSSNDFTAEEKTKLQGIEAGADENIIESITVNGTAVTPENKTVAITIPAVPTNVSAFTNDAGYITSADVPEGAAASTSTPLMDGTAAVGAETSFARGDHRHPSDTSKQDVISDLATIRSGAAAGATAYQKPSTGIPSSDMATGVQDALTAAGTAYQKPSTGIPASDLTSAAQTSLGLADTAVQPGALNTALADYATTTAMNTAISTAISSVYRYKDSVAAYANLPASDQTVGDVYNVVAAYGDYPAGTNWAWNGSTWDALGGSFTIDYMTNAEVDTAISNIFA